jgi:16S rRNA (uracil1498-N3)-methyltransferase
MQQKPRHRLATDAPLRAGAEIILEGNQAHYLTTVLRLAVGDRLAMFNCTDGEWLVRIADIAKKKLTVTVVELLRPPSARGVNLTICFAPIKGGRL